MHQSGQLHRILRSTAAALILGGCLGEAGEPSASPTSPAHGAAEETEVGPASVPISAASLYDHEREWPHQVALTQPWTPDSGGEALAWGVGVLIRVAPSGRLRVDFGRQGKYWVPPEVTDVVERANAIREGREQKFAPNLVLALQQHVMDPSGGRLVPIPQTTLVGREAFLLLFADPLAEEFGGLVASLVARRSELEGLTVVLLPRGEPSDAEVYRRCHDLGLPGGFLLARYVAAYSAGFLEGGETFPWLQLVTPEGRLVFAGGGSEALEGVVSALPGLSNVSGR